MPRQRRLLSKDMREFIGLLQQHDVEFLVCGGHAVAFHGYPRLTMDLDILVKPSAANARRVMAALGDFGFGGAGIPKDGFTRRGTAVTLGVQPNQIDVLTSIGLSDDDSLFARGVTGDLDGIPVAYVAAADLIKAKREAGRPKDLADLDELTRICGAADGRAHGSRRPGELNRESRERTQKGEEERLNHGGTEGGRP
jgi:hypothetical protein